MFFRLSVALGLICTFIAQLPSPVLQARAQVVGIDLGSEFIKVASVRRSDGINIVLNEQTRRKTPNYVGFRGNDSFIGEDAKNLVGRFPDMMVAMVNRMIGVPYTEAFLHWYHSDMLYTNLVSPLLERDGMTISISRDRSLALTNYAIEALLGMVFEYLRSMTEQYNGEMSPKQDAVLVVPYFFDMQQRRALVQSAILGNTNIIATVHTTTAIALQYGIQNRGFGNKTKNVLILDMGSSKTEAGVYTFTPASNGVKRSNGLGTLTTKAIMADPYFGGRSFDVIAARMIAEDFHKKSGVDVLQDSVTLDGKKGIAVLMRSANTAKEILSSNNECPVTVEGIVKGRDHTTILRRSDLEKRCSHLFKKTSLLVKSVIETSGIDIKDLDAIEVHGGAIRIPKLLDILAEDTGLSIQRTLNGDEAAVLGAAFHAAQISGKFGVKSFAIQDILPYNVTFSFSTKRVEDTSERSGEPSLIKHHVLFTNSVWPSKKSVSVNRTDDFQAMFHDQHGPLQTLKVTGLYRSLENIGHFTAERNNKNSAIVRMEAKLDCSGVLGVSSVKLKYKEWKRENNATTDSGAQESGADTTSDALQPMKHEIPLQIEWEYIGRRPLSTTEFEDVKRLLMEQQRYESSKRSIAQAKNDLEALIFACEGEGLESLKKSVSITVEQESTLMATIHEIKEWFYNGSDTAEPSLESYRANTQKISTLIEMIRSGNQVSEDFSDESANQLDINDEKSDLSSDL